MTETILDSYSESNKDNTSNCLGNWNAYGSAIGHIFKTPVGSQYILNKVTLYNSQSAGPVTAQVEIYEITGTPGTDAVPTGSALATSDVLTETSIPDDPDFALVDWVFTGDNQILLDANTWYALVLKRTAGAATLRSGIDTSSPTHPGNNFWWSGSWGAQSNDLCFYVYGTEYEYNEIASYDDPPESYSYLAEVNAVAGQSFKTPDDGTYRLLTRASFKVSTVGSPDATLNAVLYAATGTYGTSARPLSVVPIAVSDDVEADTLEASDGSMDYDPEPTAFDFTGAQRVLLAPNTTYCIGVKVSAVVTLNIYNRVHLSLLLSGTDPGNGFSNFSGLWSSSSYDRIFWVYGYTAPVGWYISDSGDGTTDPTGYQEITEDTDCTASPGENQFLKYWLLDGVSVGNDNPYTMVYVENETHSLIAVFEQEICTVTLTSYWGGTSTTNPAPDAIEYDNGESPVFTAVPAAGAVLAYWVVDGVSNWVGSLPVSMTYTFTEINLDHTLTAVFAATPPGVTVKGATFPASITEPSTDDTPNMATGNLYETAICDKEVAFYAEGLWWIVFYEKIIPEDAPYFRLAYTSSADGITWSDATTITLPDINGTTQTPKYSPSIAHRGNRVYMVMIRSYWTGSSWLRSLCYNTATVKADGTLTLTSETWDDIETVNPYVATYDRPQIILDKQNRPWVTWVKSKPNLSTPYDHWVYIDHSTDAGGWTSAGGIFPYMLSHSYNTSSYMTTNEANSGFMTCLSDGSVMAITLGINNDTNDNANNGTAYRFSSSALINQFDLGLLKGIYGFEANIAVAKNDRVFLIGGVRPYALVGSYPQPYPQFLIELSKTGVVNNTYVSNCSYSHQLSYDPDFNRLYIIGALEVTSVDISMWIYDLNANKLSDPYTLLTAALPPTQQTEWLEAARLTRATGDGHKLLYIYLTSSSGYPCKSAVIDYNVLFGETATAYPCHDFLRLIRDVSQKFGR